MPATIKILVKCHASTPFDLPETDTCARFSAADRGTTVRSRPLQVFAASVKGLGDPGAWAPRRPKLEVSLGRPAGIQGCGSALVVGLTLARPWSSLGRR